MNNNNRLKMKTEKLNENEFKVLEAIGKLVENDAFPSFDIIVES